MFTTMSDSRIGIRPDKLSDIGLIEINLFIPWVYQKVAGTMYHTVDLRGSRCWLDHIKTLNEKFLRKDVYIFIGMTCNQLLDLSNDHHEEVEVSLGQGWINEKLKMFTLDTAYWTIKEYIQ
jgi:hypothetical protein